MDIEELHNLACINQEDTYIDPSTGFKVFTSHYLKKKKKCCGNKCRHCPWNHVNVKTHVCDKDQCAYSISASQM